MIEQTPTTWTCPDCGDTIDMDMRESWPCYSCGAEMVPCRSDERKEELIDELTDLMESLRDRCKEYEEVRNYKRADGILEAVYELESTIEKYEEEQ